MIPDEIKLPDIPIVPLAGHRHRRAGITKNKGKGTPKHIRKISKASRRRNRGR